MFQVAAVAAGAAAGTAPANKLCIETKVADSFSSSMGSLWLGRGPLRPSREVLEDVAFKEVGKMFVTNSWSEMKWLWLMKCILLEY